MKLWCNDVYNVPSCVRCMHVNIENFLWEDQSQKQCYIFHKALRDVNSAIRVSNRTKSAINAFKNGGTKQLIYRFHRSFYY